MAPLDGDEVRKPHLVQGLDSAVSRVWYQGLQWLSATLAALARQPGVAVISECHRHAHSAQPCCNLYD